MDETPAARTPVFASEGLRVTHATGDPRRIVVTFDFWQKDRAGFGAHPNTPLGVHEWSSVHVATRRNDWFMGPHTGEAMDAIARAVHGYDEVVMLGSSMGGYGALLMGGRIGATRAVAFSPQWSVDPAKAPFDTRWTADAAGLDFQWDRIAEWSANLPCATLVYDPREQADARHVQQLLALAPHWRGVALPWSRHPSAMRVLRDVDLLREVARGLLEGTMSVDELARLYRANRRASMFFWQGLARRVGTREAWFEAIARQVLSIPRGDPEILNALSRTARERGRPDLADALFEAAIPLAWKAPPWLADRLREAKRARRLARRGDRG